MPPPKKLHIFIFKDGEFLGSEMFDQPKVRIGREGDVDLTLESGHISRHHATVTQDGETIIITDAGSKNGIYVNDRAASKMVLGPTDKVNIGEFTLKMKLVGPSDASTPNKLGEQDKVLGATVDARQSSVFDVAPNDVTGSLSLLDPRMSDLRAIHDNLHNDESGDADSNGGKNDVPEESDRDKTAAHFDPDEHLERRPTAKDPERTHHSIVSEPTQHSIVSEPERNHPVPEPTQLSQVEVPKGRPKKRSKRPEVQAPNEESAVGWSPSPADAMSASLDHSAFVHGAEDDHDDDDENFKIPYSLSDRLAAAPPGHGPLSDAHVEMLTTLEDKVIDLTLVRAARGSWSEAEAAHPVAGIVALRCGADGECLVVTQAQVRSTLRRGAQAFDAAEFMRQAGDNSQGIFKRGESVVVQKGRTRVHLRHVYPPTLPPDERGWFERLGLDLGMFGVLLASGLTHALLLLLVTIMTSGEPPPAEEKEFTVAVKQEPQLQEAPKAPEPPPPPPPEREKPQKRKAPRKMAPAKRVKHEVPPQEKPVAPVQAPPGILGLLSKKGATQAPGAAAAVAAVSNLNAVKVPGATGGYRVTGLIGKLPASAGVQVGGGTGGIVTKGANNLLRGGGGGAGKLADVGERRVEGLVQKVGRGMHMTGGSLDRGSIERVVNEHTDEIQRCYERELLHDSSLAGKVQVEWVIGIDGSVKSVRQMFSSVQSPAVVRCIMDAIKTWEFPRPQGGEVVVDFPFILKGMDF